MNSNPIPFLDLVTPHRELEAELTEVFQRVITTAGFIGGPMVEEFEKAFAKFCETQHSIALNSGTDAVRFALMAAGVRSGDIAITVPHTFIATTEGISQAGALPEFVDIDERTCNMDPASLADYLENKCSLDAMGRLISQRSGRPVTAIVPVHLYGQCADMDAILELAEQYRLIVIEDACQAHGAEYYSRKQGRWLKAGSMGQAAAFSFYPGKNLGACGEAGAVTTNNSGIASHVKMLRDHGQAQKYYHDIEGYNGRLDAMQAGFLSVKLKHLGAWNEQRRARASEYGRLFANTSADVTLPYEPKWSKAVYHLYVIRVADREKLMQHLKAAGIGAAIHYPIPLHLQKAYRFLQYRPGDFPGAERIAAEIVSLPMFPQLTAEQQARVAAEVLRFCDTTESEPSVATPR